MLTSTMAVHRASRHIARAAILIALMLVVQCADGQAPSVPLYEKEDLRHRIIKISKCLQSRKAGCVGESISVRGVILGVDGPRIMRNALVQKLSVDHDTQCLFWGAHCANSSTKCSISSEIASLDTSSFGEPRAYGKSWQVDVEPPLHGGCSFSFVFQLEDGYWKLRAISYP